MEIQAALLLFEMIMEEHGLISKGWTAFINSRMVRYVGRCHWDKKRLDLNRTFVEMHDFDLVHQTMLHEIAHALCSKKGHGPEWKEIGRTIGVWNLSPICPTDQAFRSWATERLQKRKRKAS